MLAGRNLSQYRLRLGVAASVKYAQGRWRHKAAIADYDIAIRLQSDNANAYHNRDIAERAREQAE